MIQAARYHLMWKNFRTNVYSNILTAGARKVTPANASSWPAFLPPEKCTGSMHASKQSILL